MPTETNPTEAIPGPIEVPEVPPIPEMWVVQEARIRNGVYTGWHHGFSFDSEDELNKYVSDLASPRRIVHIPGSDAKPDARAKAWVRLRTAILSVELGLASEEVNEHKCFEMGRCLRDAFAAYEATLDGGG